MRVKVISCENPTWWYADMIGQIFEVEENTGFEGDWWCESEGGSLSKIDCEVVVEKIGANSVENTNNTESVADTNPKQALGLSSIPMNLLSPLACAYGSLGKLNGKLKYGGSNFIGTEVIMSIYMDAIRRHLDGIMAGEEFDPADGVPHFGAMLANIDIILCARAGGTLIDDRPLLKGYREEMSKLKPIVDSLYELHKDKNPKHYLLKDAL